MSRPATPRRWRGLVTAAAVVLGAGAVFMSAPSLAQLAGSAPAARTAAAAPKPASAFRLYQLNMCMWGNTLSGPCFAPNTQATADGKDAAVVSQITTYEPDAVTLNEGCKGDLDKIMTALRGAGLSYTYQSVELGRGTGTRPRQCEQQRGDAVNAVIAKGFDTGTPEGGYFQTNGARAWMCSIVSSGGVRVCTGHLSLPPPVQKPQAVECNILRSKVRKTGGRPTVFAGDTNINYKQNKTNCAPGNFWGLQDIETDATQKNGQSGMQQIYYSPDLSRQNTCGEMHAITWPSGTKPAGGTTYATDHKGYLLDLYKVGSPTRGADCTWRDLRPSGWAPDQKWLHGYTFHQEAHSGWTGPAAARLALTMQAQVPYQSTLHDELGPTPADMTNVLNDHLAADGAPRFYKTRLNPTEQQLRSDMRYDFPRGTAIVAQIKGSARDTQGRLHTAKSASYIDVVGYYDNGGDRLTVENIAAKRDDLPTRRYNLTVAQFHQWLLGGYSA